ncbi:MAG: hypothetical protein ACI4RA_07090 [Kiritimatiellia bacterium]
MKKLMIVAAAALFAAVGAKADVESANIVGYTTKTVEAGKFNMIGVQFNKTGDASDKIDMNDLIKLSDEIKPGTFESDFADTPEIQVFNGVGYDKYYYISDATDDDDAPLGYPCWADIDGYQLKDVDKLDLGKGFWFKSSASGSVSVMGEVSAKADAVVPFPGSQFAIIANPFPAAFSFANVTTTGIAPGTFDSDFVNTSEIQVFNGVGYNKYYYISDATDAADEPVGYDCWADIDGYILEGNQVGAGAAFWIKATAAGTMGFRK